MGLHRNGGKPCARCKERKRYDTDKWQWQGWSQAEEGRICPGCTKKAGIASGEEVKVKRVYNSEKRKRERVKC